MRRMLCFSIASSLVLGGLYILYAHLLEAESIRGFVLLGTGSLVGTGVYWLWIDFIRPVLRSQRPD